MQKITPFLWFDDNCEEAMQFYTSVFDNAKIIEVRHYENSGPNENETVVVGTFQLEGQQFMVLNGGPYFKFTPAISFFVNAATAAEVDHLWKQLSDGGIVMMEVGKYPFSERFGWLQDKFGVSWQISLSGNAAQKINPFLMFTGKQHGKAEEAINFYTSLFNNSGIKSIKRYNAGEQGAEGTVMHASFTLDDVDFMAIDSNAPHKFEFSQATSFYVNCKTQEEVDMFWEKLSQGGEIQQCGWLLDKYGVAWQIIPEALDKMLNDKDPVKAQRAMHAMLQMKKIDIRALQDAYDGK